MTRHPAQPVTPLCRRSAADLVVGDSGARREPRQARVKALRIGTDEKHAVRIHDRAAYQARLAEHGYLVGPPLGSVDPSLSDCLLIAVTEKRSPDQIEGLCKALAEVVA